MKKTNHVLTHLADATAKMEQIKNREGETSFCIEHIRYAVLSLVAAIKEIHQQEDEKD